MGIGGSISRKRTVVFTGIVIGTAAGAVNLVHNLNTEDFIYSIREPSTEFVYFGPIRPVDPNTAEIDWTGPARTVNITITG